LGHLCPKLNFSLLQSDSEVILKNLDGTSETYSKMIRIGEDATRIGLKLVAGDRGKAVVPKLFEKHKKRKKAKTRSFAPFAPKVE
jgi:hypothetical protein